MIAVIITFSENRWGKNVIEEFTELVVINRFDDVLLTLVCVLLLIILTRIWLCVFLCLQLDNADEQAAQVRRELDGRLQSADEMTRVGASFDNITP